MGTSRRAGWVLVAAILGACSYHPRMDDGASPVVTGQRRVTYGVRCGECTVMYTTATGAERETVKGSWSITVGIDPHTTSIASLDVVRASGRDRIYRAVIELDGKKVAEAGDDVGSTFSEDVRLTALLTARAPGSSTGRSLRRLGGAAPAEGAAPA